MQHKIQQGDLLDEKGNIFEPGYAFSLLKKYDRNKIKASKWRIKEWDYYYVGDDQYGVALTIDDNGYMGLVSASILDFKNKKHYNKANIFWFCFGKVKMPSSSDNGNIFKKGKGYQANFINENGNRSLYLKIDKFNKNKTLEVNLELQPSGPHSMVIATPFLKKKHFYYNQKINNLIAKGSFKFGDLYYEFNNNARGVLDWGRGVWTYSNTWYWSSLNSVQDGHNIGFNLGYGFGDTKAASENMLFVDDKVYKFEDVVFDIPKNKNKEQYLSTWKIHSKDKKINLSFEPILDRHDSTNAIIISQNAHQVFGRFSGTFETQEGTITITNLLGFAEKVKNRW